ncbi:hypothetical protein CsSME_00051976 [Camellia sinensis var. sinensis]
MAANVINNIDHSLLQDKGSCLEAIATGMLDASLSWKDIEWLRSLTSLPILIKGMLTLEDDKLITMFRCLYLSTL